MVELWFKSGSRIAKARIIGNLLYFAGDTYGLDNWIPMNSQLNEKEKKEWERATQKQKVMEVIKDFKKQGFKLIHKK